MKAQFLSVRVGFDEVVKHVYTIRKGSGTGLKNNFRGDFVNGLVALCREFRCRKTALKCWTVEGLTTP